MSFLPLDESKFNFPHLDHGNRGGGVTQARTQQGELVIAEGYSYKPVHSTVGGKYSGFATGHWVGMFREEEARLSLHANATRAMTSFVVKAANNLVAESTWRSYRPVINHLEDCEEFLETRFQADPSKSDAITFVAYLASEKELRADTISKYLSAWRQGSIK